MASRNSTDADRDQNLRKALQLRDTDCTGAMLRRTTRRLTQVYDQALRPVDLRLTQYSILANLAESDGLSVTELAERLTMERTTLTRTLRPLERAGLIRVVAGSDRRSRAVEITAAGSRRFDKAIPLWRGAERSIRRSLGREQTAELRRLLDAAALSAPL